jgi:uncharacterized protein (DUF486 family)
MPSAPVITVLLLIASNIFMTFAWYAHLRNMADRPWYAAALVSWGIALFEYLLQVPANRIGATTFSLAQLKIIQEAITRDSACSAPSTSCSAAESVTHQARCHIRLPCPVSLLDAGGVK